jgi:hypothetical protein
MTFLKSLVSSVLGNWQVLLASVIISAALGSFGTYKIMHNANLAAQNRQAQATVHTVTSQSQINVSVGDVVVRGIEIVHDKAEQRAAEIPTHVTPQIDHDFPVPLGFVRVWNSASGGPIPGPSAGSDADPSGVPVSAVAGAHSKDVETIDTCRTYLNGWWAWYDKQSAVWNKAIGK